MEDELAADVFPEPIDKKIAVVEKVAEAVGLKLDIQAIEAEVLQNVLNETSPFRMDPFKDIKHRIMKKKLNKIKKEHDIIFVKPHHKTVGHIEVKAMDNLQCSEVLKAVEQLKGGLEEMKRAHGHTLDPDWKYLGIIVLPNLQRDLKQKMCQRLKICDQCAKFILVGDISSMLKDLLDACFPSGSEHQDESMWRTQYKDLAIRVLAMEHMAPPVGELKRIIGTEKEVVAAFSEGLLHYSYLRGSKSLCIGDRILDLSTASAEDLQKLKKEKHIGSPTSILFLTKDQHQLRREKRVVLLADFSTGGIRKYILNH